MKEFHKLHIAVLAALSIPAIGASARAATEPGSTAKDSTTVLSQVVVTAQRRAQNVQDVPITIQALSGAMLSQLNVATLDDYVKYLPNVSTATAGPGQGNIFMRGLSIGAGGTQASGSIGNFPNVAVYLDDQPAELPGRNLDVYAADIERVEVLEGPQGTLFGAGAEAGVIRYITNKPRLDETEADFSASYGVTAHGDPNTAAQAVLNLPLIPGKLAARAVIYDDQRGGYIDNVPATFARSPTDLGIAEFNGGVVPAQSETLSNVNLVRRAINPVTYKGARLSVRYDFNDDWNALIVQSYQDMDAEGVFYEMPFSSVGVTFDAAGNPVGSRPLPPLSVTLFNPSFDKDRFENTALTVHGRIGVLKAVYSGTYLVRNVDQIQDYTNYARGVYADYYQCVGLSNSPSSGNAGGTCYSPSATWKDVERNTHLTQEIRLSTPSDWRLRAIGGFFWEDYGINDNIEYRYKTVPQCAPTGPNVNCFLPLQTPPGQTANDPGVRGPTTAFLDDFTRGFKQSAVYASVDYDIVPHALTLTLGTRYYRILNNSRGGDVASFGCFQYVPTTYFGACQTASGTNVDAQNPNRFTASGFRSRVNLSWKPLPDVLLYYTFSQGYRPGGFNHGSSGHLPDANGVDQFFTPNAYASDSLTNNEVGWKTEWLAQRVEFNGALYREDWRNVQVAFFDPQGGLGNLTFETNGPSYRVKGLELQFAARLTRGLTIRGAASWNSSSQTNSPFLVNNNPASPNFGHDITSIPNPYGPLGSPLANSPPFQGNLRVRYDWSVGEYQWFWQVAGQHQAHSYSATGNVAAYEQPPFTTYDGAVGVAKGPWTVQFFGQNLTDTNKSLFTDSAQFVITETPMRPRVLGVRFSYRFSAPVSAR